MLSRHKRDWILCHHVIPKDAVMVNAHRLFLDSIGGKSAEHLPTPTPPRGICSEVSWRWDDCLRAVVKSRIPSYYSNTVFEPDASFLGDMPQKNSSH